jgi:hypothetical protein
MWPGVRLAGRIGWWQGSEPSYNGACEAGHGSIRYRAELLARRDGRPGDWSLNHLAGARDWANDLVERRRPIPPSQRFAGRPAIAPGQRLAFRRAVLANKERRCTELRRQAASGRCTRSICSPSITRPAIAAALRDLGYRTDSSTHSVAQNRIHFAVSTGSWAWPAHGYGRVFSIPSGPRRQPAALAWTMESTLMGACLGKLQLPWSPEGHAVCNRRNRRRDA